MPLRRAGPRQPYRATLRHAGWDGIVVDARTPTRELRDLRVGLLGAHQADNAAVALALLDALAERWGLGLDEALVRTRPGGGAMAGPARAARRRRASASGRVLLDGAHNPAGAAALARALKDLGLRRPTIVFGAMRGKKVRDVLRALAPLEPRFVFTRVDDPGALDARRARARLASASAARRRRHRRHAGRGAAPWPTAIRSWWPARSTSSAPFGA